MHDQDQTAEDGEQAACVAEAADGYCFVQHGCAVVRGDDAGLDEGKVQEAVLTSAVVRSEAGASLADQTRQVLRAERANIQTENYNRQKVVH